MPSPFIELLQLRREFKIQKRALPAGHQVLWLATHKDRTNLVVGDGPTPWQAIADALMKVGWTSSRWVKLAHEKLTGKPVRARYLKVWEVWSLIPRIETDYEPHEQGNCWARIEGTDRYYRSSTKRLATEKLQREDPQWLEVMARIN